MYATSRRLALLLLALTTGTVVAAPSSAPIHPLESLSRAEIESGIDALRAGGLLGEAARLVIFSHNEPPKQDVLAWKPGEPFRREGYAVILDRSKGVAIEAIVDIRSRKVLSQRPIEGLKPWVLDTDTDDVPALVRADPRWQEAMHRRGVTDFSKVIIDPWTVGVLGDPDGDRLIRVLTFYPGDAGQLSVERPVEGVTAFVDGNTRRVVRVVDSGVRPFPGKAYDLGAGSDRLPASSSKDNGAVKRSFTVERNEVRWHGFRFRFSLHPREGLVLHEVGFDDHGTLRPILYRASLSELLVPYADPDPEWAWRSAFDVGEEGLGANAVSLERGRHVPQDAMLFDGTFTGDRGEVKDAPRTIAIFERDGGLLWMHHDKHAGRDYVKRRRELVVTSTFCFDNYDYAFSWIFGEDASIQLEVGVSGLLLVKSVDRKTCSACDALVTGTPDVVEPSGVDRYGMLVDENLVAPNHQHFLNFRLDFDVDGTANTVVETAAHAPTGAAATGNAYVVDERVLRSEREAMRETSTQENRTWRIVNPRSHDELGHLRGYMLVPGDTIVSYAGDDSHVRQQAGFIEKQLWVTRFHAGESNAAGPFPDQIVGPNGVPRWVGDDEPLVGEDIVLWHTFGITHHPRPEEWPIMSIHKVGFKLLPMGFFAKNPAFDEKTR